MMSRLRIWRIMVHVSVLIIILGGILTCITGKHGYVYLQEGAGYAMTWRGEDGKVLDLPFGIRLEKEGNSILRLKSSQNQGHGVSAAVNEARSVKISGYRFTMGGGDSQSGIYRFKVNHDPIGEPGVYAGYILFIISLAGCGYCRVFSKKRMEKKILGTVAGTMISLLIILSLYISLRWLRIGLSPMLNHPLLTWHIGAVIGSYILFAGLSVGSVISLCGERISGRVLYGILYGGLILLSIGIALGSVWAADAWGSYWSWDPKETWALICMIIYVVPLHPRYISIFRSSKVKNIYYAFSILMVLFLWLGVDRLFSGLHSY